MIHAPLAVVVAADALSPFGVRACARIGLDQNACTAGADIATEREPLLPPPPPLPPFSSEDGGIAVSMPTMCEIWSGSSLDTG